MLQLSLFVHGSSSSLSVYSLSSYRDPGDMCTQFYFLFPGHMTLSLRTNTTSGLLKWLDLRPVTQFCYQLCWSATLTDIVDSLLDLHTWCGGWGTGCGWKTGVLTRICKPSMKLLVTSMMIKDLILRKLHCCRCSSRDRIMELEQECTRESMNAWSELF